MGSRYEGVTAAVIGSLSLAAGANAQGVIHTFVGGGSSGQGLGHAVRPAGDVDGDGVGDVIGGYRIGSSAAGTGSGSARVWSGASGALLWTFVGAGPQEQFGRSVAGAGDVDGDGHADLIVGAAGADGGGMDAGSARVYSGADGSMLYEIQGPFARARFGTSVAGLGDVDGDGYADFAASGQPDSTTPQPAGFVRVYSGADGSLLREHTGDGALSRLGCAIADCGDVDGDGVHDLVVGDWRDSSGGNSAGAVHVFSGADGAELFVVHGAVQNGRLGTSVDGAGDVDGDGRADVIAGAPQQASTGAAHVWSSADGALLWSYFGEGVGDLFGAGVAGLGDVDGDGVDDLGVGAPADDDGGSQAGSARVYSGADGSELFRFDGNGASDELGTSLARVGDLDGDGGVDFAIGAPGDNAGGGGGSGTLRVHAGIPPPLSGPQSYCSTSPNSVGEGARMGWSGSTGVEAGDLVLSASGAPAHTLGMFLYGAEQTELPFQQGTLCLGGAVMRLRPVQITSREGQASYALGQARAQHAADFTAGSTWNFQFLYLDVQRGNKQRCRGPFNLSDGLSVTFTP